MGKVFPGHLALPGQEIDHGPSRAGLQAVRFCEARAGRSASLSRPFQSSRARAILSDRWKCPVALLRLPERRHADPRLHGDNLHVLVVDLLDAPALGAEDEAVPEGALPDELLVQLADERLGIRGAQAKYPLSGMVPPPMARRMRAAPRALTSPDSLSKDTMGESSRSRVSSYLPASMSSTRSNCRRGSAW